MSVAAVVSRSIKPLKPNSCTEGLTTDPGPVMLPERASRYALPLAFTVPFTVRSPPVMLTLPLALATLPSVIASASVTVMLPEALAARLAAARLRLIEPLFAVAEILPAVT